MHAHVRTLIPRNLRFFGPRTLLRAPMASMTPIVRALVSSAAGEFWADGAMYFGAGAAREERSLVMA